MGDGQSREGYHDPTAGLGGAAPARSALTLRLVLATFGLLVCSAGAVVFWATGAPAYSAIAAAFAVVALVDLSLVIRRKRRGEPG
jgi:hypothetical protein